MEITAYLSRRFIQCFNRADERSFIIQCLTGISNKYGRDTKRIIDNECRRRGVPSRIAACLERIAQASVRETRCIRLLLYQQFTVELFYHAAIAIMFDEGIMLFCRAVGKGLEPMRVMGYAFFQSPHFHSCGYMVCYFAIDWGATVDGLCQGFECLFGEIVLHRLAVENIFTKILRHFPARSMRLHCFSVGSFLYCIKAEDSHTLCFN